MTRYLWSLGLVALAFAVRLSLDPWLDERAPFLLFTFAVAAAGLLHGLGPGLLATAASLVVGSFAFLPARGEILPSGVDSVTNAVAFALTASAILFLVHHGARGRKARQQSEQSLRSAQAREQRLIDAAQDYAIYELDRDGRILTWNKGAERLKGWKAEEIIGKPYDILHTPEQRARSNPGRELAIAAETGRFEEEAPRLRKDGSIFAAHVSLFPLRDDGGEVTGFVKVTRDISEQRSAGRAIMDSRRRLEGIVNSAMDAIITVDGEQRVILFNPAAERMFGCSAEDALGKSVSHFIPERFRAGHDEHIRRFRETGVTNRRMGALGAISGLRASGEEFPIEASISQVTIEDEHFSTVILRDITERKTSEEARSLLAREVDHRAKNALAVAQALVSLTRADDIETFAKSIRGRISALGRAHSLLSQSQWRGVLIEELIRDELSPYARDSQLELEGGVVTASPGSVQSLSLLFHELATNAVKYGALGGEEGRVYVSWALDDDSFVTHWVESGGPRVEPPTREGFGTNLLKQVAGRQLRAALEFDWDPAGLRATIRLPADAFMAGEPLLGREADRRPGKGPAPARRVAADQRSVLLVEDEELVAIELKAELERLGWSVVGPAASLDEAEQLIGERFSAAVLDVNLQGRMVYPFATALAERRVPFLFCTGYELVDPEGRFPDAPVIRKPADAHEVSRTLLQMIDRNGG